MWYGVETARVYDSGSIYLFIYSLVFRIRAEGGGVTALISICRAKVKFHRDRIKKKYKNIVAIKWALFRCDIMLPTYNII